MDAEGRKAIEGRKANGTILASLLRRTSACVVTLREPSERALSHYYEFVQKQVNMSAWEFLQAVGPRDFVNATGGNVQTVYLESELFVEGTAVSPQRSAAGDAMVSAVFTHCLVGTQEGFDQFIDILEKLGLAARNPRATVRQRTCAPTHALSPPLHALHTLLHPWTYLSAQEFRWHSHARRETTSQAEAISRAIRPLLLPDLRLWQRARCQMSADYAQLFPHRANGMLHRMHRV